eukprot:jgi/Tetstr1/436060/TSEL_024938.t1
MIIYSKNLSGLAAVPRLYGSALPRVVPKATLTALVVLCLHQAGDDIVKHSWMHPYPYQVFAFIVGFAVTYRCNYSYGRYMEGATSMQTLADKLCEAAITFSSFSAAGVPPDGGEGGVQARSDALEGHRGFQAKLLHLTSLLHAVALQQLRCDAELDNLLPHSSPQPPPVDAAYVFTKSHIHGVCQARRLSPAESQKHIRRHTTPWPSLKRSIGAQLSTSYHTQDSHNWLSPLTVLGGLLDEERSILERLRPRHEQCGGQQQCASRGLCMPTDGSRFYVVLSWLHQLLHARVLEGGLAMPSPLISRPYALLSDACAGFSQAKKIAETPFPYPWTQTIWLLLFMFTLTAPLMICAYIKALWLQLLITCLAVSTYWALNEVARDLEDPFVYHPNDLPLAYSQHSLNEAIQAAAFGEQPSLEGLRAMASGWGSVRFASQSGAGMRGGADAGGQEHIAHPGVDLRAPLLVSVQA